MVIVVIILLPHHSLNSYKYHQFIKAKNRETGAEAAAKIVDIRDETELDDFMVEIDILAECKHKNVINLYEAYYFDSKLWVSWYHRSEPVSI